MSVLAERLDTLWNLFPTKISDIKVEIKNQSSLKEQNGWDGKDGKIKLLEKKDKFYYGGIYNKIFLKMTQSLIFKKRW